MHVAIVTLFPDLVRNVVRFGVTGRALEQRKLSFSSVDPREFASDRHRTVDDRPYGGGPGMVMKVEPLRSAIRAARQRLPAGSLTVLLGPQGQRLDQALAATLATLPGLVLVAGRYEGVDERLVETEIDIELSIGDYVLSGGELPAMVVVDTVARLLPGVLGSAESAGQDSFASGLLEHPHYTRPEDIDGMAVPGVLKSGDHARIERWRLKQSLGRTWTRRRDLLEQRDLSRLESELLQEYIAELGTRDAPGTGNGN